MGKKPADLEALLLQTGGREGFVVEFQGKWLKVRRVGGKYNIPPRKARGGISFFSRAARFRMLQWINKVDWRRVRSGIFCTLTYPPERVHYDRHRRNAERKEFVRLIEKITCKKIGLLWRVEWLPRKSGSEIGKIAPHMHCIIPSVPTIRKKVVRGLWADAIRFDGWVSVDWKRMPAQQGVAMYIAKYCSKVEDVNELDIPSSVENLGKHWGITRPSEFPLCPVEKSFLLDASSALEIQDYARQLLAGYEVLPECGFTLIGPRAVSMLVKMFELGIAWVPRSVVA